MLLQHIIVMMLRNRKQSLAFYLLGGMGALLALAGICFLVAGLFWWLHHALNPEAAALITGAVLLIAAVLAFLKACDIKKIHETKSHKVQGEFRQAYSEVMSLINDEYLGQLVAKNPKMAIILSAVAGFIARERIL